MSHIAPVHGRRQLAEQIALETAAKLREANRLLTMAGNLAQLGYWRVASDDDEFELSQPVREIFAIPPGESVPPEEAVARIHPQDRIALFRAIVKARRGEADVSCCARAEALDGRQRHVLIQLQADKRPGGAVGLFGIIRDTTSKVAVEENLISARDDAEAATLAKSEFLATMSHEIRTPMTGVMGMIELLQNDPSADERDRYLGAMKQSAELLMSVLDAILDFSKAEAGKIELQNRDFDLAALASRTIDMVQNAASKKGLLFTLKLNAGVSPIVHGDPIRIQQVMSNLISNAVKFTDSGHVTLTVDARPAGRDRQLWRVQIDDSGVGIEPAEIKLLFEPFVQMGNRLRGGTGLGLAICRRLVEAMGGMTGARSVPGRGSTFWFEMELPIGAALSADGQALAAEGGGSPLHILIAEDNAINQMLIAALLRRLGHRATCVDNGVRAVEAAATASYDCILLDMQMPVMDGIAATRAIRALEGANGRVPIIALTADAAPERRRFYDNVGLTDFMTKPVSVEALRRVLSKIKPAATRPLDSPFGDPVIDLERSAELQSAIGPLKFAEMLTLVGSEVAARLAAMRSSARAGDAQSVRADAHSLKGAAANAGAMRVARACKSVELALPGAELELALEKLEIEAQAVREALPAIIEALSPRASHAG